jgi:hypothetical protein
MVFAIYHGSFFFAKKIVLKKEMNTVWRWAKTTVNKPIVLIAVLKSYWAVFCMAAQ